MDNFLNKILNRLKYISLKEILDDTLLRNLFIKFVQYDIPQDNEAVILLKRFILCEKLIANPVAMDRKTSFENLIERCPSFVWEIKLQNLMHKTGGDLDYVYILECLKWETIIELICHNDYKRFLEAIKTNSKRIRNILATIYTEYFQ